jgi:hypothetical protein
MPPKRRKCVFNEELQQKYPYLKSTKISSEVQCFKCKGTFSIANSGKTDIENHIGTGKHKRAIAAEIGSSSMTSYFKKKSFQSDEKKLAAIEGAWAYHTVVHNQTFRSMDCTCKLIKHCFEPRFTCARTKCESIIDQVFVPYIQNILDAELNRDTTHFVSIYFDSSNHKEIKIVPIIVRYFLPETGVHVKILELKDLPGETSTIMSEYILEVLQKHNIKSKLLGICADNTNSNFGGRRRHGTGNIFYKIKADLGKGLIGVGCAAHIINNSIQTAADCLPVDVMAFISKIYSYFYIYTVRVNELKEFCEFVQVEYKKVLGYSATRWLALRPAVERVLQIYSGLKSYFLSIDKCPTLIKNCFENPETESWLYFLHNISTLYQNAVLKIEKQEISIIEIAQIYSDLKMQVFERKKHLFLPFQVKQNLKKMEEEGISTASFKENANVFYNTCHQYLEEWGGHFDFTNNFQWILLNNVITHDMVETCSDVMTTSFAEMKIKIDEGELFDETSLIIKYVTPEKINHWKHNSVPLSERWVEIFKNFRENDVSYKNFLSLVEYCLCLPGSNAASERVFSLMNQLWTSEKSQLKVTTLKSLLITKYNFKLDCVQFYMMLLQNEALLKTIHSSKKYIPTNQ